MGASFPLARTLERKRDFAKCRGGCATCPHPPMMGAGGIQRMLVLCYGIQKSGSTLAFELVRGVLESAGFEQPFLRNERFKGDVSIPAAARNYVEGVTQEKIVELTDIIGPDRKIAVKTHGGFRAKMFPWLEEMQARAALQIIVSWRDPRDICLSLLDAGV